MISRYKNILLDENSKLASSIVERDRIIEKLDTFIVSILKALELTNSRLAESSIKEYKKLIGTKEENSQEEENTETEGGSEARQDSI